MHIDALFGEPGRDVIDFDLIESQFRHLMRVAVSVREGAISSTLLLRRLRSGSRKNATALRRLLYAEAAQFPDLLELTQVGVAEPVAQALADRLARLALEGRIDISDPALAAEHLTALLTGSLEARSRFGTRRIPRLERKAITESAVATFLSAFAPRS